jgi:hypothetical protein
VNKSLRSGNVLLLSTGMSNAAGSILVMTKGGMIGHDSSPFPLRRCKCAPPYLREPNEGQRTSLNVGLQARPSYRQKGGSGDGIPLSAMRSVIRVFLPSLQISAAVSLQLWCGVVVFFSTVAAAESRFAARQPSRACPNCLLLANERHGTRYHADGSPSRWPRAAAESQNGGEDISSTRELIGATLDARQFCLADWEWEDLLTCQYARWDGICKVAARSQLNIRYQYFFLFRYLAVEWQCGLGGTGDCSNQLSKGRSSYEPALRSIAERCRWKFQYF